MFLLVDLEDYTVVVRDGTKREVDRVLDNTQDDGEVVKALSLLGVFLCWKRVRWMTLRADNLMQEH